MSFELTGQVRYIGPVQQFNNNFTKREFVIDVENGKYINPVSFDLIKDKTSLADKCNIGDTVTVKFSIGGREYKKPTGEILYFNSHTAFYIDNHIKNAAPDNQLEKPKFEPPPTPEFDESEDVPF